MLTALLVVVVGLAALLAIPLTLSFRIAWREAFDNDIRVKWAFGLVRARIPSAGTATHSGQTRQDTPERKRTSKRRKRNVLAAVRLKRFRRRIFRFIGDLWHAIHKQDVRLAMRVGLGDPADTGRLWAVVGPVSGLLADVRDASIRIEPEFLDATFELDSSGSIRVIPLQMLYLAVALLLSPPVWQGIRQMRVVG